MTLDIHSIMQGLAKTRPIFHSEANFQFALAWRIKELMPDCEVRLEFKPFPDKGMYLDIWLPTIGMMLELKYLRRSIDTVYSEERFILKDGTALDADRYDFLKDIERLERVASDYGPVRQGIAVLLANEHLHWEPRKGWQSTIDAAFRIHEGQQMTGKLNWAEQASAGSKKGRERPISLTGSYTMRWQDYYEFDNKTNGRFRYLAVPVGF